MPATGTRRGGFIGVLSHPLTCAVIGALAGSAATWSLTPVAPPAPALMPMVAPAPVPATSLQVALMELAFDMLKGLTLSNQAVRFDNIFHQAVSLGPAYWSEIDPEKTMVIKLWTGLAAVQARKYDNVLALVTDEDIANLRRRIQDDPKLISVKESMHIYRGEAFLKLRKLAEALVEYNAIDKYGENAPSHWRGVAVVLAEMGDENGAAEHAIEYANAIEDARINGTKFDRIGAYANRVHSVIALKRSPKDVDVAFEKLKTLVNQVRASDGSLAPSTLDEYLTTMAEYGRWTVQHSTIEVAVGARPAPAEEGFRIMHTALDGATELAKKEPQWPQARVSILEIRSYLARSYYAIGDVENGDRQVKLMKSLGSDLPDELNRYLDQIAKEKAA